MNIYSTFLSRRWLSLNLVNTCIKYSKSKSKIRTTIYHRRYLHSRPQLSEKFQKIVGYWFLTCSGMVFVAVSLGGITRLTESGLSMVTWKFLGEKLPNNEELWLEEFQKYQKFPEYKFLNKNITLEDFKRIWWMEYIHRMWGRLIGATFLIPASYLSVKYVLNPALKRKIYSLGTLIAFQGFMGWYMVKSGLENNFHDPSDIPRVSQYRLACHLGLAFVIYSGCLYNSLDYLLPLQDKSSNSCNLLLRRLKLKSVQNLTRFAHFSSALIFLTAISGAFVAGLDAGLIYNTFPKMSGKWIPDDILTISPIWKNLTENPTTAQFNHRIMGMLSLFVATSIALVIKRCNLSRRAKTAAVSFLTIAYIQAILGILTLLNHVPIYLAAMHQSGSLILLSSIVWLCHEIKLIKRIIK